MPNRRRRKLSTAMSAVAALAVASPFALTAVSELNASSTPAPQQHDFVQAATITDLPGEIMSALQSSLSQFGIVMPNMSTITGSPSTPASTGLMQGALAGRSGMTAAGPATAANSLAPPNLADPTLANPTLNLGAPAPALPSTPTTPTPTAPGLSTTNASVPPATGATSALPPAATGATSALPLAATGATSALPLATGPNPAVTPATGLSALPPATGVTTVPSGLDAASPLPAPGQVGITADPQPTMYPMLGGGDSSLGLTTTPAAPSGGLLSEVFSQLGGTQAIDLLKGVVVPSIMQAIKSAAAAPAATPAVVPAPPAPTP